MTSKQGTPRKRRPLRKDKTPVDKIIDATAVRHADRTREEKLLDEREELGPRRRIGNVIYFALVAELKGRRSNGLALNEDTLGKISEEASKSVCKATGLEVERKKTK